MTYKSDAQRRFFHSPGAKLAGIKKETVNEFDHTSKGMKLPELKTEESDTAPGQKRFNKIMSLFKGNK